MHSGTLDISDLLVSARAVSRLTSGHASPISSGRFVPSQVLTGMENVTGMTAQPSLAAQTPLRAPASAVACAPLSMVLMPAMPARYVSKVRDALTVTPPAEEGIEPPPTVPTTLFS